MKDLNPKLGTGLLMNVRDIIGTVKALKIGTSEMIATIVMKMEQFGFTMQ